MRNSVIKKRKKGPNGKSACIATMVGSNLGNRLQNYALQSVLQRSGLDTVETFMKSPVPFQQQIKNHLYRIKPQKRWARFAYFDLKYINYSKYLLEEQEEAVSDYSVFVMGSDQIWNPSFTMNSDLEYLPKIPTGRKIAYAASFGVSSILERREEITRLLNDIPYISVRENAGADIVEELTERKVPVVLDPVMLLSKEEWQSVGRKPRIEGCTKPFVLKYVLGNDAYREKIESIASVNGLVVIDLKNTDLPIGPAEFIWLAMHSTIVCTDSFHASVFSILFHKPFFIFERQDTNEDMSCRLDTVCDLFKLEHCRFASPNFNAEDCYGNDWSRVDTVLEKKRLEAFAWLTNALEFSGRPTRS